MHPRPSTQVRRLSGLEIIQVAALVPCSTRSVDRAYSGTKVTDFTRARIAKAARELKLPEPPAKPPELPASERRGAAQ